MIDRFANSKPVSQSRRLAESLDLSRVAPTLHAYVVENGAEATNFRRYTRRDFVDGYAREAASIRVGLDGELTLRGDLTPLSPEKAAAVKAEVLAAAWPKSVRATNSLLLRKDKLGDEAQLFEMWSLDRSELRMVLSRDLGDEKYLPWSYWNDGRWRCMEPD